MTDGSAISIGGNVSQSVVVSGHGNTVSLAFGDSGVVLPLLRRHVRPPDRRRSQQPGEPPRELDLLDPERGGLPFVGRQDMMAQLRDWTDSEQDVSVHALVGRAGSGKTRLALALCDALDREGPPGAWRAGFLSGADLALAVDALAMRGFDWSGAARVLVVLDDAAQCHRALARWLDRLVFETFGAARLRILLLEREAPESFGWWHDLVGGPDRRNLFHESRPVAMTELADPEERRRVMAAAFEAAARMRSRPVETAGGGVPPVGERAEIDRRLAEPQFGSPLNLVMAGVLAVDQGMAAALALRRLDAARRLGERELERFGRIAEALGVSRDAVRHALAFNALAGGLAVAGLPGVLAGELKAAGFGVQGSATVATLLEQELPPRRRDESVQDGGGQEGPRLGTLQPDLVAEATTVAAFTGEDWREAGAPTALARAYAIDSHRAAAALMRLVQDFAYAIEDPTASAPERATGHRLMAWLDALVNGIENPWALAPIADAFPAQSLVLREAAAQVQMRVVVSFRDHAQQSGEAAHAAAAAAARGNLATRLSHLGQRETAVVAAQEAVDLYRALAVARPEAFTPNLAMSLNNVAIMLSDLGQREAALGAAQEAVDLRRVLAATRPDAFTPDLAKSLSNVATTLSDLGQREAALVAAQEAVNLYRTLAVMRPNVFTPDLASSINNMATTLSDLGQREAALVAAQEAVDLRRVLAAARPDAFTPDLAASLNNVAITLSDLNQREAALAAAREAVDLRRVLAATRPDAFTPDLATSLNNVATMLSDLGQREGALVAAQEAVDLYRTLAAARPEAFTSDLAMSLNNMAVMLRDLGKREAALAAARKAVDLRRVLAAACPDAFTPDLATSLNNVATMLSDLGQRKAALAAAQGAVDLRRVLAAARPDTFTPNLVTSLWILGDLLADHGQTRQAVQVLRDGIARLTPYALAFPDLFRNRMRGLLQSYVLRCGEAGVEPDGVLLEPLSELLSLEEDST